LELSVGLASDILHVCDRECPVMDSDSPVVRLCAAGMAVDGDPEAARALFRQAWAVRQDDLDASIAAHFLARHQPSTADTLYWNRIAVEHAESVPGTRAEPLLASLYLNLADSHFTVGDLAEAAAIAVRGVAALEFLPPGGYREFVAQGLLRLQARIRESDISPL
jgi:hypothetical protein